MSSCFCVPTTTTTPVRALGATTTRGKEPITVRLAEAVPTGVAAAEAEVAVTWAEAAAVWDEVPTEEDAEAVTDGAEIGEAGQP